MLAGKQAVMALISPGAPSLVTVVGNRIPRCSMLRKDSVQHAWDSLLPTARCSRCLRPSLAMHQATSRASLAPCRRSDWKDRINEQVLHADLGEVPGDEGLVVLPEPVGDLGDARLGNQRLPRGIAKGIFYIAGGQPAGV